MCPGLFLFLFYRGVLMGWFYPMSFNSRPELVEFLCGDSIGYQCERRYFSGNVLWVLMKPKPGAVLDRWIACYLLGKHGGQWGYKPLSEAVGPFYFSCPMSFLELAPVVNSEWREGVREYWEARKARRRSRRQTVAG